MAASMAISFSRYALKYCVSLTLSRYVSMYRPGLPARHAPKMSSSSRHPVGVLAVRTTYRRSEANSTTPCANAPHQPNGCRAASRAMHPSPMPSADWFLLLQFERHLRRSVSGEHNLGAPTEVLDGHFLGDTTE